MCRFSRTVLRMKLLIINCFSILLTIFCLPSKSQECGQFTFTSGLIVGGHDTVRGEFPFLIALLMLRDQSFFCAANLISQRHALTAAHCIFRKFKSKALEAEDFIALLGKYNLKHPYENGVVSMNIKQIDIHDDWKPYTARYDADIALLHFKGEVQPTYYIHAICLPSRWQLNNLQEGGVVGWGLSNRANYSKVEDTPRRIVIKKPPTNEFCFLHERDLLELSSNRTFCAGGENSGPCSGDSGGGFFVNQNSIWTLQGLVSSTLINSNQCDVTKYSIYTNVAFFVDWIDEKINGIRPVEINSFPIALNCDFGYYELNSHPYACDAHITSITTDDLVFSTVIGDHLAGKTNRDVGLLNMNERDEETVDIRYIPSGISDILPNLKILYIQFAKLSHLSRKNFKRMTKVSVISLTNNQIEYVDEDTFYEVPRLFSLRINGNRLKSIPFNLFIHSSHLQHFTFDGNFIEEFDGEIFRNCPLLKKVNLEDNNLKNISITLSKFSKLQQINLRDNVCINSLYKSGGPVSLDEFQSLINKSC